MYVFFDVDAPSVPDSEAEEFARRTVAERKTVSVSNMTVFDWIRAVLVQIPVADRPLIRWFVQCREVHFDDKLFSEDAWCDETDVREKALEILLANR